jgi:hypothetical protein
VAGIVHALIGVDRELERVDATGADRFAAFEKDQQERFRELGKVADLQRLVDQADGAARGVQQIASTIVTFDSRTPPLMTELYRPMVAALANELSALSADQQLSYDGDDRDRLLHLVRGTKATLDGIDLSRLDAAGDFDTTNWSGDIGSRYLLAQEQLVGVEIRRLFAVDNPELLAQDVFQAQCKAHVAIRADVRVLLESDVPDPMKEWIQDIVIFDRQVTYEKTSQRLRRETKIYFKDAWVAERARQFEQLWQLAKRPAFLAGEGG